MRRPSASRGVGGLAHALSQKTQDRKELGRVQDLEVEAAEEIEGATQAATSSEGSWRGAKRAPLG